MNYLVVGLGNIGAEYANTRHNMGFMVLDAWAQASNISFESGRYGSTATVSFKGRKFTLLKPSTYMNLSGKAVRYWMNELKVPVENILVISDDLNIPFGTLRLRKNGSAGGHNGLKSVIECLKSQDFPRIKLGVGQKPSPEYPLTDWVVGKIPKESESTFNKVLQNVPGALELMLNGNTEKAMCDYNGIDTKIQ